MKQPFILLTIFTFIGCGLFVQNGMANTANEVRIGVLAKRGPERCLEKWEATAAYLTEQISDNTFTIVPLGFDEVIPAVERREVDFVLSNPSFYVILEQDNLATRIATLKTHQSDQSLTEFGGVLICRQDNESIASYKDIQGKRFGAVADTSFGGWRVVQRELCEQGIDPVKDCSELVARVPMFGTDKLIAGAFGLGRDLSRDLALDRPLNRALRRSVEELPRSRKEWDLRDEIDEVGRYLATASMIAEILGPGARVSPSLRERILVDIGKQSFEVWDYPSAPNPNLLGV